jgi:hypothetical protein
MIRNMHGTISLAGRSVGQVPPVQQHKPPARTAASGAACVPVACPIERSIKGAHGRSRRLSYMPRPGLQQLAALRSAAFQAGAGGQAVQHDVLTDSLTRQAEVGETCHNAGGGDQPCALASETRSDPGDQEDARRSAPNPAIARAVEMVGKRPAQRGLHPQLLTRADGHARSLGWLVLVVNGAALGGNLGVK